MPPRRGSRRKVKIPLPIDTETADTQEYLDRTTAVNALRSRKQFAASSFRLLTDLVDVLAVPAENDAGAARNESAARKKSKTTLDYLAWASPVLFQMLPVIDQRKALDGPGWPATQIVWIDHAPQRPAPLEALAHVLGAAVARDFNDSVAILTFATDPDDGRAVARLWRWREGRFVAWRTDPAPAAAAADFQSDEQVLDRLWNEAHLYLQHLFIVAPESGRVPEQFELRRFCHRIVYVTDAAPECVPPSLLRLLRPEVRTRGVHEEHALKSAQLRGLLTMDSPQPDEHVDPVGPYFCSFIVSLVGDQSPTPTFDSIAVDEEANVAQHDRHQRPGWRLLRDQCRVPFNLKEIEERWKDWDQAAAFADVLPPEEQEIASRWARSVTNRQVGVALSGGGASGFRLLPVFKRFEKLDVPVDIVSGVSGGSLIAGYYCARGMEGLARCVRSGPFLQQLLVGAMLHSGLFRWLVDRDLDGARVEALPVRFVAVATGLREQHAPQAHVITRGTVGEAIQASGSAPVGFAPTDKQTVSNGPIRYVDGALAAMVPARVLKDFGADYVFAFNCLAGPERRNPLDSSMAGKLIYALTPFGRLIDLWVSGAYLIELASRETAEDCHIYYDPEDVEVPLAESFWFSSADTIVRQASRSKRLLERIKECAAFWQMIKERGDEATAIAAQNGGAQR